MTVSSASARVAQLTVTVIKIEGWSAISKLLEAAIF